MLPSGELSDELGGRQSGVAATSGDTSGAGSLVIACALSSQRPLVWPQQRFFVGR
jgi:hypothetical protein